MDKKICKEFRIVEKRLKMVLGKDIHNHILGFILPCKVGDIWSGGSWSGRDVSHMMVTRCTPDKVWLKQILWDRANSLYTDPKWIDNPNPSRHKPGKSTRRTIDFDVYETTWDNTKRQWRKEKGVKLSVTIGSSVYHPGLIWRR